MGNQEKQSTILLVDDHPTFRKGLKYLLEDEKDMLIIGEAGDGQIAIDMIRESPPDVVVMDITMPNLNGIEATRQIVTEFPNTKIVALSLHSERQFVQDMLQAGASGFILKESVPEELVKGIRAVMLGEGYLSTTITDLIVKHLRESVSQKQPFHKGKIEILEAKLRAPQIPRDHVHRARLVKFFENNRNLSLQLLVAPAGYGKSTVVSCWLKNHEWPTAWISLDKNDNDLRKFGTYLAYAVRTMFPNALSKTTTLLKAADLPPVRLLAEKMSNEIEKIGKDFILVLDDFHLVDEKSVRDLLIELLRHPPRSMHFVLMGRSDPFLPKTRLYTQGLLAEIHLNDWRFTDKETLEFLQSMFNQNIDESTARAWNKKAEGWITGLRLAALSVCQHVDWKDRLSQLPGSGHYVMEYLLEEIFENQPEDIRKLLMIVSLTDRFCAPLINALLERGDEPEQDMTDSWKFIALLKDENMFIIDLDDDRRWYRFHHLFRELLKKQLISHYSPEDIGKLHLRASDWFESEGLIEEAIMHTNAAGDSLASVQIIERSRHAALDTDRWHMLDTWLDRLPLEIMQERPEILQALALYRHGQLNEALALLEEAVIQARPSGLIRPFVEFGQPMAELLKQLRDKGIAVDYIEQLLDTIKDNSQKVTAELNDHGDPYHSDHVSSLLADPLTGREQETLDQLVMGKTNKEIADNLYVSVDTVKTHLKKIYQKLDVNTRLHAVIKAKKLGVARKKDE